MKLGPVLSGIIGTFLVIFITFAALFSFLGAFILTFGDPITGKINADIPRVWAVIILFIPIILLLVGFWLEKWLLQNNSWSTVWSLTLIAIFFGILAIGLLTLAGPTLSPGIMPKCGPNPSEYEKYLCDKYGTF